MCSTFCETLAWTSRSDTRWFFWQRTDGALGWNNKACRAHRQERPSTENATRIVPPEFCKMVTLDGTQKRDRWLYRICSEPRNTTEARGPQQKLSNHPMTALWSGIVRETTDNCHQESVRWGESLRKIDLYILCPEVFDSDLGAGACWPEGWVCLCTLTQETFLLSPHFLPEPLSGNEALPLCVNMGSHWSQRRGQCIWQRTVARMSSVCWRIPVSQQPTPVPTLTRLVHACPSSQGGPGLPGEQDTPAGVSL